MRIGKMNSNYKKTRLKILTVLLILSLFSGCMSRKNYTKEIKTDKCPPPYYKMDNQCVSEEDNVLYFTTSKSSVTFHYPKGAKIEEETRLVKKIWYNDIIVNLAIINYQPTGHNTFEEYFDKVYYPSVYKIVDNESRIRYNQNKEREDSEIIFLSAHIVGHGNYFGYEGWLFESETFNEKNPSREIITVRQYIFPLDDPYAIEFAVGGQKDNFNESYAEVLPYLNKLEIEVLDSNKNSEPKS